jgi:hypothetical protein
MCVALHYAADAGHSEVAGSLVIAGTLVTAYSAAGWTAAHLAAMKGHTAVIDKLLIGGYQIDCPSHYPNSGWTAAHVAARQGHLEVRRTHPAHLLSRPPCSIILLFCVGICAACCQIAAMPQSQATRGFCLGDVALIALWAVTSLPKSASIT